jgi:hypothetical protein
MVTSPQLKETIYDELVATLAAHTGNTESTIESNKQVRPTNRYEDGAFPAYVFDTFDTDINRGMGSGVQVHNVVRNADDTIDKLVVRREKEMRVDVGAHATGDRVKEADELYSSLEEHFTQFVEDVGLTTTQLHSDVQTVRLRGTTDVSSADDGIRGERFRWTLNITHTST